MSNLSTHLQYLEEEAITIIREAVANATNPVLLYSIGKDSGAMLHLMMKAFYPVKPPVPLLHVDALWDFKDMYELRDTHTKNLGVKLHVFTNPRGREENIGPFSHGARVHTQVMRTDALKMALNHYKFDFIFVGARRDEEKSRAKERIFSLRNRFHVWDPKNQRPEFGMLFNTRLPQHHSMRVSPLSNWTEYDVWNYIASENIPFVPLYLARERPVVWRENTWIMVDDERFVFEEGEKIEYKKIRFRTLGCYPLTGGIESKADTIEKIIAELEDQRNSERAGRVIDHDTAASMEKKKKQGYF